jgi:hypothetical protein
LNEIIRTKYPKYAGNSNLVTIKFNRVNVTKKIQEESHTANLYNNNLITRSEARVAMGYSEFIDEQDTCNVINARSEVAAAISIATAEARLAPTVSSTSSLPSKTSNGKTKNTSNKLSEQNVLKLGSNQNGKFNPTKTSVNK